MKCSSKGNKMFGFECEGPQWESPRYFTNGKSLLVCEKHAKAHMKINPFGPKYQPAKARGK